MAKNVEIMEYKENYKEKWNRFIKDSINGTFLQSRHFLDYHPTERFVDNSLLFMNGSNIIAIIPATVQEEEKKILYSHKGSTFGGIVLSKQSMTIGYLDLIFDKLNSYLIDNGFDQIILKQPGRIYLKNVSELLDYYYFLNGYSVAQEVGYYIDYSNYDENILSNFSSSRRRDFRYSLKSELSFKKLQSEGEIKGFYDILCDNYTKFDKSPVHSLEELVDFKFNRLPENTDFYGVYLDNEMIAGGMIFKFDTQVFHTQYLAVRQDKTKIFANEFMYEKLIETAKSEGFKYMSFGTSTFEGGKKLNRQLAQYKEGFGTCEYVNRTYFKVLK